VGQTWNVNQIALTANRVACQDNDTENSSGKLISSRATAGIGAYARAHYAGWRDMSKKVSGMQVASNASMRQTEVQAGQSRFQDVSHDGAAAHTVAVGAVSAANLSSVERDISKTRQNERSTCAKENATDTASRNVAHQRRLTPSKLVEIVVGQDAVDGKIYDLGAKATSQVDTIITGTTISAQRFHESQAATAAMYDRGVVSRSLYLDEFRDHSDLVEYVLWLNSHGSSVRTLPTLPKQMIIFDKSIAILPSSAKIGKSAIIVHRDQAVVDCLKRYSK